MRGREKQSYTFKYDHISRMTEARYADIANNGTVAASNRYDELLEYDVRGNIKRLQRWGLNASCGWGQIDNLNYFYNTWGDATYLPTNKLQQVVDNSDLAKGFKTSSNGSYYSYDSDGNLTTDPNKGITNIAYNHLNLPTNITFTNNRTINFLYDAGGNKLRKTVVDNGTTQYIQDYIGGIEYRTVSNVMTLEAIHHSEGRVTNINGTLKYEYALKDHLGNTRIMFCDKNNNGIITQSTGQEGNEVTQENHYYPFGLNMESVWQNTPSVADNKYQYNGKELNSDFGLEWNDYGARFYDAAVGRWHSIDPLSEKTKQLTPYRYGFNNPIKFIDPNGKSEQGYITGKNGELYYDKDVKSQEQLEKKHGKDRGLKYEGEEVVLKNGKTGDRLYGDKDGKLSLMPQKDAEVKATKPSTGNATFVLGVSATGALGLGVQGGYDLVWMTKGKDASFFPYVVYNDARGVGYNADVDIHAGFGTYNGFEEDITADNVLNTAPYTGYTASFSATAVIEGGVNYSYAKATKNTSVHTVTVSAGLGASTGVNGFAGKFASENLGRIDRKLMNALKF